MQNSYWIQADQSLFPLPLQSIQSREKQIPQKIKQTGVTYPILLDAEQAASAYGPFNAIPTTFIINRKGEIVKQIVGARSYKQFEKIIKEYL